MLERRLDDPNYDSLTQSTKRKEQKEMNDVSVVDLKVRIKDSTVQSNDTNKDTDNDTSNVTWSNHAQQRTYSDRDDAQQCTYGDGDDTIDISETITSVNKPYIYKSYKDACNGSKEQCSESTITYGRNPITYGRETITHHDRNRINHPSSKQVTSE